MKQSQYIRILLSVKTFLVVVYIFFNYASFIWVCSPCWHYDSKLPPVFFGALIDGNNRGQTKNAIDYLNGDLSKHAFPDNAVKANVRSKPHIWTNTHNSDDNENTNVVD